MIRKIGMLKMLLAGLIKSYKECGLGLEHSVGRCSDETTSKVQ